MQCDQCGRTKTYVAGGVHQNCNHCGYHVCKRCFEPTDRKPAFLGASKYRCPNCDRWAKQTMSHDGEP